jgi:tryptophanyl-tRNA synthetase
MHTSPGSCLPACARVGDLTESAAQMEMLIAVLATGLDPERGLQTQQPVRASHRALRFLSRGYPCP